MVSAAAWTTALEKGAMLESIVDATEAAGRVANWDSLTDERKAA